MRLVAKMDKSNSCVTAVKTYTKQPATEINSHVLDNKQYTKHTLFLFLLRVLTLMLK